MNFKKRLEDYVKEIDERIKRYLPKEQGYQKTVLEAMNYSVLGGGKRLRPMLIEQTYRLFGGENTEEIEPFMAAMEMIHTYSLVHDDLPAMDDDEYRRGRKTTHVVYGEAMGILAGDGLLNYAYETACKSFVIMKDQMVLHDMSKEELQGIIRTNNRVMQAMTILSAKPGINGMLGGQVIDVLASGKSIEKDRLDKIYEYKTSALIEASMRIGAVMAGANDSEQEIVEQVAKNIGLAFQIQDDILDETSTTLILGKPVHSDSKNEKTTYVTLFGVEGAKRHVDALTKQAMQLLKELNRSNEFLEALLIYLIDREK